ncbi:MAG: S1 RNA-binding domain-containing protein [Bianqueaceae bacterium]
MGYDLRIEISLSTKFPETNPWNGAEEKYAVGSIVEGTVVRFADFGAFVELEKGVDALIHISHLSRKFVKQPSDVLTIGERIQEKIIDLDLEQKRISLSLRDLEPEDEAVRWWRIQSRRRSRRSRRTWFRCRCRL